MRATPTAQTHYRNKGIELVGAEASDIYCRQYVENQAARRSRSLSPSSDTIVAVRSSATPIGQRWIYNTKQTQRYNERRACFRDTRTGGWYRSSIRLIYVTFVESIEQLIITITTLLTTIKRFSSLRRGITIIFRKTTISSTTHLPSLAQFAGDPLVELVTPVESWYSSTLLCVQRYHPGFRVRR